MMTEPPHAGTGRLALAIKGRLDSRASHLTVFPPLGDRARSRFAAATDYVEQNLDREIALSELASSVALSVSHFAHAFKAQYGVSPYRYIIERRIERAKGLLRTTDHTIASIAQRVGFSSQAHFGEHFAKVAGVTPSAYRRAASLPKARDDSSEPVDSHAAVVEASAQLRTLAKRLWATSTIDEALTLAAEASTQYFDDASLVFFVHRVAPGRWRRLLVADRGGLGARNEHMFEELALSLPPESFDEIALYPALSNPGDIGMRDTYRLTSVADAYEAATATHRLQRSTFIHARVLSRDGTAAGITVKHEREHVYSELERATVSAIASMTSLALS